MVFPVKGLHCAGCVAKVEKAASAVKGVEQARADLVSGTLAVRTKPGADVSADLLRTALDRMGYELLGGGTQPWEAEIQAAARKRAQEKTLLMRLLLGAAISFPLTAAARLGLSPYTELLLGVLLQLVAGRHFHEGLIRSLKRKSADMDTLVSLSTWTLFGLSTVVAFWGHLLPPAARAPQWDALASLVTIITLGRYLESRTRGRAGEAIACFMGMAPKTVRLVRGGREETVLLDEARPGDLLRVRPGEQISLDGEVAAGISTVDESLLTGESMPVEKSPGARVFGGSFNQGGSLDIMVLKLGEESALARIIDAVRRAQSSKPRLQRLADRVAAVFVPSVFALGALAAVLWAVYGPEPRTINALMAIASIFAVSCPCALGLATPLAVSAGIGRAAQMGILVRDADIFEKASRVDTILFDKTGTLTQGRPRVTQAAAVSGTPQELFRLALAAEKKSEHPFARAIVEHALAHGAVDAPLEFFESIAGRGVRTRSAGLTIRAGSVEWLASEGIHVPGDALPAVSDGRSLVGVAAESRLVGFYVLDDALRPGAAAAVSDLKGLGLAVGLVSGDRPEVCRRFAAQAGIPLVFGGAMPEEKAGIVSRFQDDGKAVAVVGEGFNDAPALSKADLGIALAAGTDVAVQAADITLGKADLGSITAALRLLRATRRVILENLFWAFAYNVLLIPVAAGVLYPIWGLTLKPQYGAVAMALSSVSVVLNSLRLRYWHP